jgi:nitrogen fixation NifU-like protein
VSEIYAENILYHYEHPSNKGTIKDADIKNTDMNTLCGDQVTIYVSVKDGKAEELKFQGIGCAISQASASMLTDKVRGFDLKLILDLGQKDILEMLGIESLSPMRLKCAMLALRTLQKGIVNYFASQSPPGSVSD